MVVHFCIYYKFETFINIDENKNKIMKTYTEYGKLLSRH